MSRPMMKRPVRRCCLSCRAPLTATNAYRHPTSRSGLQARCKRCDNAVRMFGIAEVQRRLDRDEVLPEVFAHGSREHRERARKAEHRASRVADFTRDEAGNVVRVGGASR